MEFRLAKGGETIQRRDILSIAPTKVLDRIVRQRKWDPGKNKYVYVSVPVMKIVYVPKALPPGESGTVTHGAEYGILKDHSSLDISIGIDNDFEIKIPREASLKLGINYYDYFYCPGTEFGGRIEMQRVDTSSAEVIWEGKTWRGLLEQAIITPGYQQDYYIASGDANDILRTVLQLNGDVGSLFTVPQVSSGVSYTNYQFNRYVSKLRGLEAMLLERNHKIKIWAEGAPPGGAFSIKAQAVPIQDYSQEIEYSQNNGIAISMTEDMGGINHLICLGDGDLRNRQRVDLYVSDTGSIEPDPTYVGASQKTAIYDYPSVEGDTSAAKLENLRKHGIERLMELQGKQKMELKVDEVKADIGDIVGGRDNTTGLSMSKPVTGKIYRCKGGVEDIELKVDGGTEEDADY